MFAKIEITGTITSETGLHIGANSDLAAIGAIDSPVVRDAVSNEPMIPGSSLKGKMRTLLSRQLAGGKPVDFADDDPVVQRVFGSSADAEHPLAARLQFSDMRMTNAEKLRNIGVSPTEAKFENTINRLTGVANPRQIERSVRGGKFALDLIYNMEDEEEAKEDFKAIRAGLDLLEYDYIGGSGSRGYGKISFSDVCAECVIGDVSDETMDAINRILSKE